jgi:hypothetical protein
MAQTRSKYWRTQKKDVVPSLKTLQERADYLEGLVTTFFNPATPGAWPSTITADAIYDGTTNSAYTATEQDKLAGIMPGAINAETSIAYAIIFGGM